MTEGQVRYQTVAENQRHNLEMERLNREEIGVSKRNVSVKEAEEQRAQDLHQKQKNLMYSQTASNWGNVVKGASDTVVNIFKAARGFFGLFNDAASLAGGNIGSIGSGYYQGSLFE